MTFQGGIAITRQWEKLSSYTFAILFMNDSFTDSPNIKCFEQKVSSVSLEK